MMTVIYSFIGSGFIVLIVSSAICSILSNGRNKHLEERIELLLQYIKKVDAKTKGPITMIKDRLHQNDMGIGESSWHALNMYGYKVDIKLKDVCTMDGICTYGMWDENGRCPHCKKRAC